MTLKWIVLLKNHKNRPVAGSFNPKPPWVWQSRSEEFAMRGGCFGGENQKKGHHQRSSKSLLCARKERPCELQKKKVAPQTGSILVWIIIILPPNSGEDLKQQKKIFAANWLCFSPD